MNAPRSIRCRVLARLCWAALAIIHVPIFVAVVGSLVLAPFDLGRLGSGIALALTLAFFVLKACGAPLLRFRTGRQAFLAYTIITALVHAEAIVPPTAEVPAPAMVAVVTTLAVGGLYAGRTFLPGLARSLATLRQTHFLPLGVAFAEREHSRSRRPFTDGINSIPRGPPALA